MQTTTDWSRGLGIEVHGDDVVSRTGSVITRMLVDNIGLTSALSDALYRPDVVHDRGAVMRDLAVSIADGASCISDIAVLGDQSRVFGPVASTSTLWRTLNELDERGLSRLVNARNEVRRKVWDLIEARHGRIPGVRTAYGDLGGVICIRIDATLVTAHSDKECAAGNFKGGWGFHPLLAWCDNTGELLAIIARSGNAGSNTAADHIAIIDAAIAAIPERFRHRLLITIDGAGSSHDVLDHIAVLNARKGFSVEYSVGFDLDSRVRNAIALLPENAWEPALDATGKARADAAVAEVTGLLRGSHGGDQLVGWPAGMRIIVRREPIETGAQLSLFEQANGYRYQPLATGTAGGHPQRLEARHRVHARVEALIRCAKATGLARWPSSSFAINRAWVAAVAIAVDLLCWTRLLLLDGPLATAEPDTLRYRLLHTGARLIKRARKLILRIPETWPWATELETAFHRVLAIP
jgi:DDE family transposase